MLCRKQLPAPPCAEGTSPVAFGVFRTTRRLVTGHGTEYR
jgi:hypothetical protein